MKRVAIIAPTGMLGSMIFNILKDKYNLILVYRKKRNIQILNRIYKDVYKHSLLQLDLNDLFVEFRDKGTIDVLKNSKLFRLNADCIINCAGIIKPYAKQNSGLTFFINSALPHMLSSIYENKLVQITTDCVFSGLNGAPYNEMSLHTPTDLYGLSKSLGEPKLKSLVLRTSIIGPEISNHVSLISWFQKQKKASGFTNHHWNGVTTKQFGEIIDKIISKRNTFPSKGLFHIFSNSISKYELLMLLRDKYNPECEIKPYKSIAIDRRLSTIYKFNSQLKIPSLKEQIEKL